MKTPVFLGFLAASVLTAKLCAADIRIGIVGTDTSHVTAFTQMLNDPGDKNHIEGARVTAAYKGGSPDIESSRTRIDKFTKELQDKWHVQIAASIPELCGMVDAVLLESVDGRVHAQQARQIVAAHKPLFIDKPLAATIEDVRQIAALAKEAGVPWFSASSLRFDGVADLKSANLEGAATWGPGPTEEHHHLELAWYAIHPIEMLYTLMGEGCEEVTRVSTGNTDMLIGKWKNGRIGTVRALRPYSHYGAIAFRKTDKDQTFQIAADPRDGYAPLVREIVKFFQTGTPPVPNSETLEIYSFIDAAQRSKESGGTPTRLR